MMYQDNFDFFAIFVNIFNFLGKGNSYKIDSNGVEHILSKFIFLRNYACTAKRINKLDLPTPLFPINKTFIVRSLSYWMLTGRYLLAFDCLNS